MSDYYCTNCGADLGDQDGFDPNASHWTCTVCGYLLFNPATDNSNSRFGDVGWFCDGCGAYLNDQSGFSDWNDKWTCTECGYTNNISGEEIYETEEDYQKTLNESDNTPSDDDYGCEWEYYNPRVCCGCGRVLNRQSGFSDWMGSYICEKCGTYNSWNDESDSKDSDSTDNSSYSFSEAEEDDIDDEVEDNEDDSSDDNYTRGTSSKTYTYSYSSPHSSKTISEVWQDFLRFIKGLFIAIVAILVICLIAVLGVYVDSRINPINISDVNQYSKVNYEDCKKELNEKGFIFVSTTAVSDLEYEALDYDYMVADLIVEDRLGGSKESGYSRFSSVEVVYHRPKYSALPVSSKEVDDYEYKDMINLFENAGFGNIEVIVDYDIIFGVFNKTDMVESVTVDGKKQFSKDSEYRIDVPIVVTYHDKVSNKPK